jgi:hypothetical protein
MRIFAGYLNIHVQTTWPRHEQDKQKRERDKAVWVFVLLWNTQGSVIKLAEFAAIIYNPMKNNICISTLSIATYQPQNDLSTEANSPVYILYLDTKYEMVGKISRYSLCIMTSQCKMTPLCRSQCKILSLCAVSSRELTKQTRDGQIYFVIIIISSVPITFLQNL